MESGTVVNANLMRATPDKDKKCLAVMYKAAGGIACRSAEEAAIVEEQWSQYLSDCEGYPVKKGSRDCAMTQVCKHRDGNDGIRSWQPVLE
jgi:hypothetical protein